MLSRAERIEVSRAGIAAPFELDPTLCLYSPQDNVEALAHPRVVAWHRFVTSDWQPAPRDDARRRVLLLLPCTKPKPYATSREHRAINGALLRAGWRPTGDGAPPAGFAATVLDAHEDPGVLHVGPLVRDGVRIDRMVLSEPLAAVPYEHLYSWPGGVSPATSYDDPGLFESRGHSVSPERADCTAVEGPDGRWTWGPAEHDAYADAHAAMVDVQVAVLRRVADRYDHVLAWVSPYLTHRSFLLDAAQRAVEGGATHVGARGPRAITGVNDALPGAVEILPDHASFARARAALAGRLRSEGRPADADDLDRAWETGDGNDTPLGLPELLPELLGRLDDIAGRSAA